MSNASMLLPPNSSVVLAVTGTAGGLQGNRVQTATPGVLAAAFLQLQQIPVNQSSSDCARQAHGHPLGRRSA